MAQRPAPVTDLAWSAEQAQAFGGEVLGLWTELLARLPELPVNREYAPAAVAPAVALPVPEEPMPADQLVGHLRELAFGQSLLIGHPAFFAYICGAGTVPGAAAELLAAGLNSNLGGYRLGPGAAEIELHLTRWLAGRFGLPEGAGGIIMSGGAMANFVGLKCARDARLGIDVRENGVSRARPGRAIRVRGGARGDPARGRHARSRRGRRPRGPGRRAPAHARRCARGGDRARPLRRRAAARRLRDRRDDDDGLDRPAARDRRRSRSAMGSGCTSTRPTAAPSCSATSCAGCSTGSSAPTRSRSIRTSGSTRRSRPAACWCATSARCRARSTPTRPTSGSTRRRATASTSGCTDRSSRAGSPRGKVWISLLAHGRAAYGRRIAHDVALARYLGELVEEHPDFELMCEPRLSICCFRHRPAGWTGTEEQLDRLNERLMMAIMADGRVYCSNAVIDGRFGLRACIVNFRTEAEDVERLLAVAAELGRRLIASAGHGDAGLVGEHDRLHAVAQPELHQHARDVRLDRRLAHDQLGRDLGVRQPARDELEHLELARGQLVEALGRRRGGGRGGRELLDQPLGDRGREQRLALRDDADARRRAARAARP